MEVPPFPVARDLRMPPFPPPPPGVTIIPFQDFQPSGIRIPIDENGEEIEQDEDAVEYDALGVATVALRVKHHIDSDEKARRRKKKKPSTLANGESVKPKTWWELWEESESVRRNAYDQKTTPADRLSAAAADFISGRPVIMYVGNLWDQFRTYTGLLTNPQQKRPDNDDDDEDSIDEELGDATSKPPPDEAKIIEVDVGGAPVSRTKQEKETIAQNLWENVGEPLAERFLDDMERSIRIFFSSYFREKGLLWSPQRCIAFPILIHYFLRYLVRCRTFQEPELDKPLRRALAIAELARLQLPASSKIGGAFPDEFSSACRSMWGSKRPFWTEPGEQDPTIAQDVEAQERAQAAVLAQVEEENRLRKLEEEEHAAKRQKRDPEFERELEVAAEPTSSGGWGESSAITTDGDQNMGSSGGWGSSASGDSGWAAAVSDESGNTVWGEPVVSAWDDAGEAQKAVADVEDEWRIPEPSLLRFLGPTTLPLTHHPAVVEKSTRRIVEVQLPVSGRACKVTKGPSAEAVEEELTRRCARVVLEPWPREELAPDSEIRLPVILPASRGKINIAGSEDVVGHAPLRDVITVLIEPKMAEMLQPVVGMGLGGTWVQLARIDETGKGKEKGREVFWYMEELFQQIPSYYMDDPNAEDD